MNNENKKYIPKYFAAANGYAGFRSYFDEIFSPDEYDRIYVLKGGPGTGKSSFMKKISETFSSMGCMIEEIYCSSDPTSLDGVIIKSKSKKMAILDGTAPHERDAKIPGAFDQIINLADNLDGTWLSPRRAEILSLLNEKSRAYKTAYFYLSSAGVFDSFIHKIYDNNFDRSKAKNKADGFLQEILIGSRAKIETRLIGSFGRYGERRFDTLFEQDLRLIKVGGSEYSTDVFLNFCKSVLEEKNANMTRFPSALNSNYTDAILLSDISLAIVRSDDFEIDADEYISLSPIETEQIRTAKALRIDSLDEARRWFTIASDIHFRLEKLYTAAMNFEKNNQLITKTIEEITTIIEKDI